MSEQSVSTTRKQLAHLLAACGEHSGKLRAVYRPGTPLDLRLMVNNVDELHQAIEKIGGEVCIEFRERRWPERVYCVVWYEMAKGFTAAVRGDRDRSDEAVLRGEWTKSEEFMDRDLLAHLQALPPAHRWTPWEAWFAWFPVRVNDQRVWLRLVDRRDCVNMDFERLKSEYRPRSLPWRPIPEPHERGWPGIDGIAYESWRALVTMVPASLFGLCAWTWMILGIRHLMSGTFETAGALATAVGLGVLLPAPVAYMGLFALVIVIDVLIDETRYWNKHRRKRK